MSESSVYEKLPEPIRTAAREAHSALHVLWTQYTHTAGYTKADWTKLSNAISKLIGYAVDPPKLTTPADRGCDARRCSKHTYQSNCEFCGLSMNEHEVA